jgi:hypothetical protein
MKRMLSVSFGLLLAASISTSLFADPPERVARLNYIQGDVTFRPDGIDEWTDAPVNRPLIAGDELWTDLDSRAELHLGSSAIRLGALTAFSFLALDDHLAQIRLSQGTLDVRIHRLGDDDTFEVDTPNLSLSALRSGSYRISVSEDGQRTEVTLRSGEMEATAQGGAFTVHPHESVTVEGYGRDQTRQIADMPSPDGFDRWCRDRDARDDRAAQMAHVPREVIGYEDLADYGAWEQSPVYGWVWAPRAVVVGWAPYHFGHWAWIEPWGWTWVDDAPWGFAPFHYGRWAHVSSRWIWVPGVVVRPVYAPALVAFAGGAHWSASISFGGGGGGVAWFPLAPGEVYVPGYRVRPEYVRTLNAPVVNVTNINVTNINVTNIHYANQNVQGAVTAVSREDFTRARPVAQASVAVSVQAAASFQVAGTAPLIAPQTASVLGHSPSGPARIVRAPAAAFSRPVVAKTTPPPPSVPFAARQSVLAEHPGRALDAADVQKLRPVINAQPKAVVRPALATGFVAPKEAGQAPKSDLPKTGETVVPRTPANVDQPKAVVRPPATSGAVVPREVVQPTPTPSTLAKPGEAAVTHAPAAVTTTAREVVRPTPTPTPSTLAKPGEAAVSHTPASVTTTSGVAAQPAQPAPPTVPKRERAVESNVQHPAAPPHTVVNEATPPTVQPPNAPEGKKVQAVEKQKDEPKKDSTKKDNPKKDNPKKDEPKKDNPKKDDQKKDQPI